MKPPKNPNYIRLQKNQVFVRDKYKKTTGIIRENTNDDPKQGAVGKAW